MPERLSLLQERLLEKRARDLVRKLDEVGENPEFQSVFQMAWLHGHNYGGPTWGEELKNLKETLGNLSIERLQKMFETSGIGSSEIADRVRARRLGIVEPEATACGEISLEGARLCVRPSGHEGPHFYGRTMK